MNQIEPAITEILKAIGENPKRQGLEKTPYRVAKMFEELTVGYHQDPQKIINKAMFDVKYDEMVVVTNIEFYSLCEHHMLPFFGVVHVGYVPNVIFPCAALFDEPTVRIAIYYGGADTVTALAFAKMGA